MRLSIVLVLVLLAGCMTPSRSPEALVADPASTTSRSFTFGLTDVPKGSDWIAVQITPTAGASFTLQVNSSIPTDGSDDLCQFSQLRELGAYSFSGSLSSIRIDTASGVPVQISKAMAPTMSDFVKTDLPPVNDSTPFVVVVGVAEAMNWSARGATLKAQLTSDKPFATMSFGHGNATCLSRAANYTGGSHDELDARLVSVKRYDHLEHRFHIDGAGVVAFVPDADLRGDWSLSRNNQTVFSGAASGTPTTNGPRTVGGFFVWDTSGDYLARINNVTATTASVGLFYVSFPRDVAEGIHLPEQARKNSGAETPAPEDALTPLVRTTPR